MAKLIQAPPKFMPPEWHVSNFMKYCNAEGQRLSSERLTDESRRLIKEIDKTTRRSQRDANKKLEQRLEDITFWESELKVKLTEIFDEIDTLLEYKARLEKALQACDEPLAVSQTCLINREHRVSIDLVHDLVERELLKEIEIIQGVQAVLKRTIEQTVEQIRRNRSAKYYLEKDLKDKAFAGDIDSLCTEISNNTSGISFRTNCARIDSSSVTPRDWAAFSNSNVKKADREKNSSIALRSIIDGVLKQTTADMRVQCNAVNVSFQERVAEMKDAKNKLEEHLAKVQAEVSSQEKNIIELKKAIEDENGPMMVSQSRLEERTERPNVELCRDRVQYRLVDEVNEIQTSVNRVVATLEQAEAELKGLARNQLLLEEDIQVKSNSLFIDEVQCMQIRETISINYL